MLEDQRQQGYRATRETLAKLRPDPVWRMLSSGQILKEHEMAVAEIREAFAFITDPVALRVSNPSNPTRLPRTTPAFERETERLVRLKRRYLDWVDRLGRQGLPIWPVFDVAIDELSCRRVDRLRRKRNGTTKRLLIQTLDLYCEMAGWIRKASR